MRFISDGEMQTDVDVKARLEADKFAAEMDDMLLDIEDLDPFSCPPDKRYHLGDREAWIYEHGNISELIFVRI